MTVTEYSNIDQKLVGLYLKYGSVENVFSNYSESIPVSYPEYHRILNRYGIIKTAGRNSCKMAEVINFFEKMAYERLPLKQTYELMPSNFQTSIGTLYRIYWNIRNGICGKFATAIILTPHQNPDLVLTARDISTPREELGKEYGSLTIPTTFSNKADSKEDAIMRVLQQEVFSEEAIRGLKPGIDVNGSRLISYIDIVDVKVTVYHLPLLEELSSLRSFSSYKLENYQYLSSSELVKTEGEKNLRRGIVEMVQSYIDFADSQTQSNTSPVRIKSELNYELLSLA